MSAAALRRATDHGQRAWSIDLARLTRHYARTFAGAKEPRPVAHALERIIRREGVNAHQRGAGGIATIVAAAGVRRPEVVEPAAPAPPDALERMVQESWMMAADHPDTAGARATAVDRILTGALALSWRVGSADEVRAEPVIVGYRRVAADGSCGACLALSDGAIQADDEAFEAHPSCTCAMEPVVREVNEGASGRPSPQERFEALSAEAQDLMFAGHGGAAKADLLRSGAVRIDDLVARHARRPGETPLISERPLSALA